MKTKYQDYGSNHVILQVEDNEPVPDTIVLLDKEDNASTYKAIIKSKKTKTPRYHQYDYRKDDPNCYWIEAECENCQADTQIAIPMQTKVNEKILKNTPCPKCGLIKTLFRVDWNGHCYVPLTTSPQVDHEAQKHG